MNAHESSVSRQAGKQITPALIQSARLSAFAQGRSHLIVLEEDSGLLPEEFVRQLAELFAYPAFTMADLQAADPAFDIVPYTDCAQRDCVLLRIKDSRFSLVISDPFSDGVLQWANHIVKAGFA